MAGYMIRFRSEDDVQDYKHAGKKAKSGIAMVMDGVERGDMDMIVEGAKKAYKGVKTMCEISDEMEQQFVGRDNYNRRDGGGMYSRDEHQWNERDDDMLERRMRDSRGRFV